MRDDDPRHGTNAGYYQGCRDECCRRAATRYVKRLRMDRVNGHDRMVPAVGTRRRVQALMRVGWSQATIAKAAGMQQPNLSFVVRSERPTVRRSTAERIATVYDQLSMSQPIGSAQSIGKVRAIAIRRGYLPPLAWDDDTIDDPDAVPYSAPKHAGPGRPNRRLNHVENAEWMADNDENLTGACARLGIRPDSLRTACKRVGRLDVYERLADREPDAASRAAVRAALRRAS